MLKPLISGLIVGGLLLASSAADARKVRFRTHVKIGSCSWAAIGSAIKTGSWPGADEFAENQAYNAAMEHITRGYPHYGECANRTDDSRTVRMRKQVKVDGCAWRTVGNRADTGHWSVADVTAHFEAADEAVWHIEQRYPNYNCSTK